MTDITQVQIIRKLLDVKKQVASNLKSVVSERDAVIQVRDDLITTLEDNIEIATATIDEIVSNERLTKTEILAKLRTCASVGSVAVGVVAEEVVK